MLFNLEEDSGERVRGYVVPDGFSSVPAIRVCSLGKEIVVISANEMREALVVAGRHETGQCGFSFDTSVIPDLQDFADLELYDDETGTLIYRRPRVDNIKKKILRIETHLFPLWALDNALSSRFQYFAKGIENSGRETVTQLFLLDRIESVYLSGRILYKNYAYFVEAGFQTLVMLQEPYEELAERLLVLSKIRKVGAAHLGMRESAALEPAMNFAESLPFDDEKALRRSLRQMPEEVTMLLANPLVRQFSTSTPDEMPGGGAVGAALDVLASSILVGRRHEPGHFLQGLTEFLDVARDALPSTPQFPTVAPLANTLRESSVAEVLLEKDLELYHYIESAARKTV